MCKCSGDSVNTQNRTKIFRLREERGEMTQEEARRELRIVKDMERDIRAVELEIERLMALATKMTPSYDPNHVQTGKNNRIEDALIQVEKYRERLSHLLLESVDYKNRCLNRVAKIRPKSLQSVLIYYYFQDNTLEKTAELLGKSYQWTYTIFTTALDEYSKI